MPRDVEQLSPEEEIKAPLVLEFLGIKDEYSESDLEEALIHQLENQRMQKPGRISAWYCSIETAGPLRLRRMAFRLIFDSLPIRINESDSHLAKLNRHLVGSGPVRISTLWSIPVGARVILTIICRPSVDRLAEDRLTVNWLN